MAANSSFREAKKCLDWDLDGPVTKNPKRGNNFRFLVITLGPTGSGKTSMADKIKKMTKSINPIASRVEWNEKVLDDYVEESPEYKAAMDIVIDNFTHTHPDADLDDLDGCSIYTEPWRTLAEECIQTYFAIRSQTDIHGYNKVDLFNNAFHKSLTDGQNIIFEITGRNILTVVEALNAVAKYTNDCERYNYIILAGYNLVDFYSLQNRNIGRFIKALNKYRADPSSNPPRLPWVGCFNDFIPGLAFCNVLEEIKVNISNVVRNCGYFQIRNRLIKYGDADAPCIITDSVDPAPSRANFNPNGLSVDILFIFNNIYKELKLVAKVPVSERSIMLYNTEVFKNVYVKEKEFNNLLMLINAYGPITDGKGEYLNSCGTGIPILSDDRVLTNENIKEENKAVAEAQAAQQFIMSGHGGGKYRKKSKRKKMKKMKKYVTKHLKKN